MRRLLTVVALAAPLLGIGSGAVADDRIPFDDPDRAGSITLCDVAGKPVTHGRVTDAPFVWSLHSDLAATGAFAAPGRTATFLAYQPRKEIDPGDWSGRVMSPASRYTDPRHPTVQLTPSDDGLDQMTSSYAPKWNGLLQLRIYLAAPGEPASETGYAALTLRVSDDGSTWEALDPGRTPCSVGKATSVSTILGVAPTGTPGPSTRPSAGQSPAVGGASPGTSPGSAVSLAVGSGPQATTTGSSAPSHRSGLGYGLGAGLLALVVAGVALRGGSRTRSTP